MRAARPKDGNCHFLISKIGKIFSHEIPGTGNPLPVSLDGLQTPQGICQGFFLASDSKIHGRG